MIRIILLVLGALGLAGVAFAFYTNSISNPRVLREIRNNPDGERAQKVMGISLPDGRTLPVNYLEENGMVFAGADGPWWRPLQGKGHAVTVLIRGEERHGMARAITDDPEYTKDIFSRLRPTAVPGFGTLVEIRFDDTPRVRTP